MWAGHYTEFLGRAVALLEERQSTEVWQGSFLQEIESWSVSLLCQGRTASLHLFCQAPLMDVGRQESVVLQVTRTCISERLVRSCNTNASYIHKKAPGQWIKPLYIRESQNMYSLEIKMSDSGKAVVMMNFLNKSSYYFLTHYNQHSVLECCDIWSSANIYLILITFYGCILWCTFCYSLKLLAFYNEQISDEDLFTLQQLIEVESYIWCCSDENIWSSLSL
jgi:hypothetical protein